MRELARDEVGVLELVARLARSGVEADAERLEPDLALLREQAHDQRRVETAGEQHADGDVRDHAALDGQPQRGEHGVAPVGRRHPGELGAPDVLGAPVDVVGERAVRLHGAHGRRGQLAHAVQDRVRRRDDGVEAHVVVQGDLVDRRVDLAALEQRRQARGEPQPVRGPGVVQRLDPEPVAAQGEHAGVAVQDGEGEHPEEALDARRAPLVEGLEQHLGVGVGEEAVAVALQLLAELAEVVDQAVEDGGQAQLVVDHRLRTALGEVEDLEPAVPERGASHRVHAGSVRPTAVHGLVDPRDRRDVRVAPVEPHFTRDTAHRPSLAKDCYGRVTGLVIGLSSISGAPAAAESREPRPRTKVTPRKRRRHSSFVLSPRPASRTREAQRSVERQRR